MRLCVDARACVYVCLTRATTGVQFCNLLEVISSKKLPKWNAKPRIKAQKLENVSFGLQFLKKEGIKLVAIGPEDVVEPKLKVRLFGVHVRVRVCVRLTHWLRS